MTNPSRLLFPILLAAGACVAADDAAPDDDVLSSQTQEVTSSMSTPSWATAPTCTPPHQVSAAPGEEGQWAMVRVGHTGASTFKPTSAKIYLRGKSNANGNWCAGNVGAFKIRIYQSTQLAPPPASPTFVAEATVGAAAIPVTQDRLVTVGVRAGTIPTYRSVWLAVQMVGDPATDSNYNCVAGCGPQTNTINWWSLNDDKPYQWVTLASVGIGGMDIAARLEGEVGP